MALSWAWGCRAAWCAATSRVFPAASLAAHARLSWPIVGNHLMHLQVRHETSAASSYTLGLVGFSMRFQGR